MNKRTKYALIGGLMLFTKLNYLDNPLFSTYFDKKHFISGFSFQKTDNNREKRHESVLSFEEAHKIYYQQTKIAIIDNFLKTGSETSIDSVIKFVPMNIIQEYVQTLQQNNLKTTIAYNRLRTLTLNGEEISQERFKHSKNRNQALNKYANKLGITPGAFGTNNELKQFLKMYKTDIIREAQKNNIDPALIAGIIASESRGRTFTASHTGALGPLGQTKYIYNSSNPWSDNQTRTPINPFYVPDAIKRSADFLSLLIQKYSDLDNNNVLALIAYNQGEGKVDGAIRLAQKKGLNPLEVLDYSAITKAHTTKNLSDVLSSEFSNEAQKLIGLEGIAYPKKVLKHKYDLDYLF